MYNDVADWLQTVKRLLLKPADSTQLEDWLDSAEALADELLDTDADHRLSSYILSTYENLLRTEFSKTTKEHLTPDEEQHMRALCARPQTEQRTEAWYKEMINTLSASELDNIFASPRIRAQLVMSKVGPANPRNGPLAVPSHAMSAFDWGIRFEPVVKQIYSAKYGAKIHELGRLRSLVDHRISASPDGLILTGSRAGRLLEIKCPVTREPDGRVMRKYYSQMQSQMFVTGISACDFVEAVFISPYSTAQEREGPGLFYGEILLIEKETFEVQDEDADAPQVGAIYRYEYSELNPVSPFEIDLEENETIIERIPWRLYGWTEQTMRALPTWWETTKPAVDAFWTDVERARAGEFVVPEGRTHVREKKEEKCMIVVNKVGQDEQPQQSQPSIDSSA